MGKAIDLAGKYGPWAVIAGASEGSGAEFARTLAGAGINLLLIARRIEPLQRLAEALRQIGGVEVRILTTDLTAADAAERICAAADDIDVGLYISNAGTDPGMGPFLDSPLDRSLAQINMNVVTLTTLCHEFGRRMRTRGRGGIIIMSSVSGIVGGQAGVAIYSAAKAFGLSLAESLWAELRNDNVDVLGIAAPPMATPAALNALAQAGMPRAPGMFDPAEVVAKVFSLLGAKPSYIFDFSGVDIESGEATTEKRHARMSAVQKMIARVFGFS